MVILACFHAITIFCEEIMLQIKKKCDLKIFTFQNLFIELKKITR